MSTRRKYNGLQNGYAKETTVGAGLVPARRVLNKKLI
jgi:hypothetical protein